MSDLFDIVGAYARTLGEIITSLEICVTLKTN